jgi:hypothetical protein
VRRFIAAFFHTISEVTLLAPGYQKKGNESPHSKGCVPHEANLAIVHRIVGVSASTNKP